MATKFSVKITGILIIIFLFFIAFFALTDIATAISFENAEALFALNTVFLAIIPFCICYFSIKSYLKTGATNVLLLGVSLLALGITAITASALRSFPDGANINVTIFNIGIFITGLLQFISAIITLKAKKQISKPSKILAFLLSSATIIIIAVVSIAAISEIIPKFFIQGTGPTLLRQVVLGLAIAMFAVSSAIFYHVFNKTKSELLQWYSFALLLLAIGLTAVLFQKSVGSIIGWLGRSAEYLAGIFFLIAVLTIKNKKGK